MKEVRVKLSGEYELNGVEKVIVQAKSPDAVGEQQSLSTGFIRITLHRRALLSQIPDHLISLSKLHSQFSLLAVFFFSFLSTFGVHILLLKKKPQREGHGRKSAGTLQTCILL